MKATQLADAIKSKFPGVRGQFPEFKICCPLCSDARFRFGLNVVRQTAHCFNCGVKLNATRLLEAIGLSNAIWYEPNDFDNLEAFLREADLPENVSTPQTQDSLELDADSLSQKTDSTLYSLAIKYLENRGFDSQKLIERYHLLLARPRSRERGRMILPVFECGKLVYYQARALSDRQFPKYLNPPKRPGCAGKSSYVFNLEDAATFDEIFICEGIFSAIAAGPNAVAVFGKELSDVQAKKIIFAGVKKAVIVFDAGEHESAKRAAAKLCGRVQCRIAELPYGDPNEISERELSLAISKAEIFDALELSLY